MPLDLLAICNDDFDGLLRDISGTAQMDDVSEERLVELISSTLRLDAPEARARGFVDLANLCYAMADKALGSNAAPAKCLKIIVSADKRH